MLKALVISVCLLAPGAAWAQDQVVGMVVRTDEGVQIGRVADVERDAEGRIISASFEGLEAPADTPYQIEDWRQPYRAPTRAVAVASADDRQDPRRAGGLERARSR